MIDLSQTYRHLGRPWTHEELAVRYMAADRRGGRLLGEAADAIPERPIALLATAIPSASTLSVAIHLLHALPDSVQDKLRGELLDSAETNAADAVHRCHRALALDGDAHGYTAEEWLPVIYDIAGPLLESSRLDREPPSVVRESQKAVRWVSSSIACLDGDSPEATAALTDTLARLLVVCVFADAARLSQEYRSSPDLAMRSLRTFRQRRFGHRALPVATCRSRAISWLRPALASAQVR